MRLILLNGPPGIGKSTIAERFVTEHPGALNLDLDAGRDDLDDHEAGLAARAAGLEHARRHLQAGHDVVIPQLLARLPFIDALERLAEETGAQLHEVVLMAPKDDAIARFQRRAEQRRQRGEADPQSDAIERAGGEQALEATYDRLAALIRRRPDAIVVTVTIDEIDQAYADVVTRLGP